MAWFPAEDRADCLDLPMRMGQELRGNLGGRQGIRSDMQRSTETGAGGHQVELVLEGGRQVSGVEVLYWAI